MKRSEDLTNNYDIEVGDEIAVNVRVVKKVDGLLILDLMTWNDRGQLSPRAAVRIDDYHRVVGGSPTGLKGR